MMLRDSSFILHDSSFSVVSPGTEAFASMPGHLVPSQSGSWSDRPRDHVFQLPELLSPRTQKGGTSDSRKP